MSVKNKRYPLRRLLTVGAVFCETRLDVLLLDENPDNEMTAHFKVNPSAKFSERPVVDELTMAIVRTIFTVTEQRNNIKIPRIFVAGHYENGYPVYYTDTYGEARGKEIAKLLKLISTDVLNDYRTPSIQAYIRRLEQKSRVDTEIIKRALNGWVIANLIIEDGRGLEIKELSVDRLETSRPTVVDFPSTPVSEPKDEHSWLRRKLANYSPWVR